MACQIEYPLKSDRVSPLSDGVSSLSDRVSPLDLYTLYLLVYKLPKTLKDIKRKTTYKKVVFFYSFFINIEKKEDNSI